VHYPIDIGDAARTGRALRQARIDAGLTQAQLAARLGTKQSVVSRWEAGREDIRLSTLSRFLRACGLRAEVRTLPDDVDRAQIRQQLALSPTERLDSVVNVSRMAAFARRSG
jgi:transcriptional regulator with XRE-family HTH domain